jgi:hypothetical protein
VGRSYRIQYLRKEHENFFRLAQMLEKMLELASTNVFAGHVKGLKALQSLERGLASIEKHCHVEDSAIDTAYQQSLQQEERARINAEHEQLIRAVKSFQEELKCATADRTMAMILPGMDVVKLLRAHIAYEQELLGRIAPLTRTRDAIKIKRQKGKRPIAINRKHSRKPRRSVKGTYLPYTLEPHPEL